MAVSQPAFPVADRAFTLARALGRLGHRCVGCVEDGGLGRAPVWFVRHRGSAAATTLVVVDLSDIPMPSGRSVRLLQAVNDCVRYERILVCERRHIVRERASAALTGLAAGAPAPVGYHRFDAAAARPDRS